MTVLNVMKNKGKIMNKVIPVVSIVAAIALMMGCVATAPPVAETKPVSDIPEWYMNKPNDPNLLFGVGTGKSARMQTARDKASQAARLDLAASIEVKFDGITKQFTEEVGTAGESELLEYFVQATKAVVSTVLTGATTDKTKMTEKENMYQAFVLIRMDVAASNKALMDKLGQQENMYTKFRASQTFKELEAETAKFEEYKSEQ